MTKAPPSLSLSLSRRLCDTGCPAERCASFCEHPPFANALAGTSNVTRMLEHSLTLLGVDYADLVLLHFPCLAFDDTVEAWRQLEAALAKGWARAIGVSNFNATALSALLKHARTKPAMNQNAFSIAGHPPAHGGTVGPCEEGSPKWGSDLKTLRYCRRHGIAFSAYSPLGSISKVAVLTQPAVLRLSLIHISEPTRPY